jgi:hypothetical protein
MYDPLTDKNGDKMEAEDSLKSSYEKRKHII